MTLILQTMKEVAADKERDEVLIPAYTCYSVPASIARAGLRPRLVDVDPRTLAMDPEALARADFSRALAVVSSNLYGIPNRLGEMEAIARERNVFMLDDSAQSLGARLNGRAVGAFGDAGLYSFDKGKIICTIQGGAVVAKQGPLASALSARLERLEASPWSESLMSSIKLPVYALFLRPGLYGAIRRMPFLGLGRTEFETRYVISRLGSAQTGVASLLAKRMGSLNQQRRQNARKLEEALQGRRGIELPTLPSGAEPVYVRFPMRVLDPANRERAVGELDRLGIGATTSYPKALLDVPEVAAMLRAPEAAMPGAREVANQIVTLPTHGYCPPDYAARAAQIISGAVG
jgi:dTDP-4-amino-4,6-dideoxygalactose transaminase